MCVDNATRLGSSLVMRRSPTTAVSKETFTNKNSIAQMVNHSSVMICVNSMHSFS